MKTIVALLLFISIAANASQISSASGEVTVPLASFQSIASELERYKEAPINYGFGLANMTITGKENPDTKAIHAEVNIRFTLEVFDSRWTAIPLLNQQVSVSRVRVNGRQAQLAVEDGIFYWVTKNKGQYTVDLQYKVDARNQLLNLATPGIATSLTATLPFEDKSLRLTPGVDTKVVVSNGQTRLSANLPPIHQAQLIWQQAIFDEYLISQSRYLVKERDDALFVEAAYQLASFSNDPIKVELFPASQIVQSIRLDGEKARVINENGMLNLVVSGAGNFQVEIELVIAINDSLGKPHASIAVPFIPINALDLELSGNKQLNVSNAAHVETKFDGDVTYASTYLSSTNKIELSWQEAIPEDIEAELRANATNYHLLYAEEGVLHGDTLIEYEVTRGETNQIKLRVPDGVLVNRVSGLMDAIVDWRAVEENGSNILTIFLNRSLQKGKHQLILDYEVLVGTQNDLEFAIPLIEMVEVVRQRGMIALLESQELTLLPKQDSGLTKVGENQLPSDIRQRTSLKIDHTYKYSVKPSALTVTMVPPVREQGKFDATVDTLISVGDVTLTGSTAIQINVKSGSLMSTTLSIPGNVNVLGLTSPALRTYEVLADGNDNQGTSGNQKIQVEYTQEMEGQFRIDVNYERILAEDLSTVDVPTLSVLDAEVEHGRLAIEALAAVEIKPSKAEQLTSVEVGELPRQLVLKTTNPILLAYRYVNPPVELVLAVTHHKELQTLAANIETATYQTLMTADGLMVTRASYLIKNNRRQFIRVKLPEDSEIWSLSVDGKAEKPAVTGNGSGMEILVKMINSNQGFPMELIFASQTEKMRNIGTLAFLLPEPDMVVTKTHWDLYLPDDYRYGDIESNLDQRLAWSGYLPESSAIQGAGPVAVELPLEGVHFGFEKLYASQVKDGVYVKIDYTPKWINRGLVVFVALISLLIVACAFVVRRYPSNRMAPLARAVAIFAIIPGVYLLITAEVHLLWIMSWLLLVGIVLLLMQTLRINQPS